MTTDAVTLGIAQGTRKYAPTTCVEGTTNGETVEFRFDQRLRLEASIGTSSDGTGSISVDNARLRENARIVRTIQGEFSDRYQKRAERQRNELREKMQAGDDLGAPDEEIEIAMAEAQLLGVLTKPSSNSPRK